VSEAPVTPPQGSAEKSLGEIVAEVRPADPRLASRGERRHVNYA